MYNNVQSIDPILLCVGKATPNFNHSSPQARVGAQFLGSSCSGEDLDLGTSPILTALQNVCNWVDGHIYPARAKQTSHASTSDMRWVKKSGCGIKRSTSLAILRQYFKVEIFVHDWTFRASAKCCFVCSCPGPNQACLRIRPPNGLSHYPRHLRHLTPKLPSFNSPARCQSGSVENSGAASQFWSWSAWRIQDFYQHAGNDESPTDPSCYSLS